MSARGDLTEEQYQRLQPHLPPVKPHTGRPNIPHLLVINAIRWVLRTGAPWRDLPDRYPAWKTVYSRFRRWRIAGVWSAVLSELQCEAHSQGQLDWEEHQVDGTTCRAHQHAAGARRNGKTPEESAKAQCLGRSRGGFSTKMNLRITAKGRVMVLVLLPGNRHETKAFEALMEGGRVKNKKGGRPRHRPRRLIGDKGYSAGWIRRWLRKRSIRVTISRRRDERRRGAFDKEAYRRRNLVERVIGKLKQHRRLATRYEKLASNYLAFWTLAAILQWL